MIIHNNNVAGNCQGPVLRPAGLRARERQGAGGSSREQFGGSGRLCGASRELWEDCRRFWKGSGEVLGGPGGGPGGSVIWRAADLRSLNRNEGTDGTGWTGGREAREGGQGNKVVSNSLTAPH